MLFKSFNVDSSIQPMGYCAGVDCGPYECNEPTADARITKEIARRENEASASNSSPTT